MTSIRIIEPVTFLHGAPVYYESGMLTVGTMSGITDQWISYLWSFQRFLKRIEDALSSNNLMIFTNIACSDPMASKFYPTNKTSFAEIPFSWSVNTNNRNAIAPLWRRYYKYQPIGCDLPFYICIEGGWKGGNNNSTVVSSSRVEAHLSISVSSSFSNSIGLIGNINTHFFPTGYDSIDQLNGGILSSVGNFYFYSNGDDIYLSMLSLQSAIDKNSAYNMLGRTSSSYSAPNSYQRAVIFSKATAYISGNEQTYEPICLMPQNYRILNAHVPLTFGLNFTSISTFPRFITLTGQSYIGVRTLVDECIETIKTQGRIIAEPYTFTDLGGSYYVVPKLIRMVDIDRTVINVAEVSLNIFNKNKNIVLLPLMLALTGSTSPNLNNIGATTIGMLLDDTVIDG